MMSTSRLLLASTLAMLAFAGNSLLCRAALGAGHIDAASFTSLRMVAGAATLALIVGLKHRHLALGGSWWSALALLAYAAGFSFAYISLPAASGALILFGAVQGTMIGYALSSGERLNALQLAGALMAAAGLVGLLLPGLSAPPLGGSLLMLGAGVAWGIYSLRGSGSGDATQKTAGNFLRAVPLALLISALTLEQARIDGFGALLALISGALTSGVGYAIWYTVLPHLRTSSAATLQLSVPVIASFGGVVLLAEPLSWRLGLTSIAILGGIAIFIYCGRNAASTVRK